MSSLVSNVLQYRILYFPQVSHSFAMTACYTTFVMKININSINIKKFTRVGNRIILNIECSFNRIEFFELISMRIFHLYESYLKIHKGPNSIPIMVFVNWKISFFFDTTTVMNFFRKSLHDLEGFKIFFFQ
jgi:hypothetical protein